jgi:hypothetical protein
VLAKHRCLKKLQEGGLMLVYGVRKKHCHGLTFKIQYENKLEFIKEYDAVGIKNCNYKMQK